MSMILGVGFVIVVVLLFLRSKKSKKRKKRKKRKQITHGDFHCVTVDFPKEACDAVKKLKGKRLLSAEAPTLPVPDCDVEECQCHFHHHEERRVEERRDAYHKAMDEVADSTIAMKPR